MFANSLTVEAKLALVRSFVVSHFKFFSTVWHFCSISDIRKIEKIQERPLRFAIFFFAIMNHLINIYDTLLVCLPCMSVG